MASRERRVVARGRGTWTRQPFDGAIDPSSLAMGLGQGQTGLHALERQAVPVVEIDGILEQSLGGGEVPGGRGHYAFGVRRGARSRSCPRSIEGPDDSEDVRLLPGDWAPIGHLVAPRSPEAKR